jgi:hypothetical protein
VFSRSSSQVRSSERRVPLTHERGVRGSGNRSHSHPARVPAWCADKRVLSTQGHFGSCVPLQLPAELPFLQEKKAKNKGDTQKTTFGFNSGAARGLCAAHARGGGGGRRRGGARPGGGGRPARFRATGRAGWVVLAVPSPNSIPCAQVITSGAWGMWGGHRAGDSKLTNHPDRGEVLFPPVF